MIKNNLTKKLKQMDRSQSEKKQMDIKENTYISLSDPYPATWLTSAISKDLFIPKIDKIKWWSSTQNTVQIRIVHLKYDQGIS